MSRVCKKVHGAFLGKGRTLRPCVADYPQIDTLNSRYKCVKFRGPAGRACHRARAPRGGSSPHRTRPRTSCAPPAIQQVTPLSNGCGIYKTVKARFWPGLQGKTPKNVLSRSFFARKRPARARREFPAADLPPADWRDSCHARRPPPRFRAKREHLERFEGLSPENQGQNLALTVWP